MIITSLQSAVMKAQRTMPAKSRPPSTICRI